MKITAISDWHGDLNSVPVPESDVVCICGDMMANRYVEPYYKWMESLPTKKVLFIPGNHDIPLVDYTSVSSLEQGLIKVWDLRLGPITIEGITFAGFWWSYCHDAPELEQIWAYMTPYYEKIKKHVDEIPACDVLVSHSPPRGILDLVGGRRSVGAPGLFEKCVENKTQFLFCGHIHEARGRHDLNHGEGILSVLNVACTMHTLDISKK